MNETMILQKVLTELKPYVIVVGSFAKGTNNSQSDIDLYIKSRPEEEMDEDLSGELEDTYIDKVIEVFEQNDLFWDSVMIGAVHTNSLFIQIEASYLFRIHKDEPVRIINLFGVEMESAIDNKELKTDERLY